MKVRNIAFFGVMASILGVGYANADTPATVIASKAYADTKEASANKANATTKAQWEAITDRTTKFPTVRAVDAALSDLSSTVSGILTSTPSTTDTSHALTNAQTTTELNKKVDIDQGDDNKGKVFVTDNSGKQKVYKLGTNLSIDHTNSELKVGTAALGSAAYTASTSYATSAQGTKADSAIQSVKLNGTALTTDSNKAVNISLGDAASLGTEADSVVTSANTTKLPTVGGVQKGIAKQGTTTKSWKTVEQNTEGAGTNLYNAKTAENQDKYVPTVKAVEARITEERELIDTALAGKQDTITSSNKLSNTLVSGLGTAATKNTIDSYSATGTNPITGTGVAEALGTLDSNVTATNQVFTKIAIVDGKLDDATSVKSGVTSAMITDGTIVNADVNATANITYSKMQNALYDINSASAATCSETNPCVLSYIGGTGANAKFKWTNMDIDGLTVNTTVAAN